MEMSSQTLLVYRYFHIFGMPPFKWHFSLEHLAIWIQICYLKLLAFTVFIVCICKQDRPLGFLTIYYTVQLSSASKNSLINILDWWSQFTGTRHRKEFVYTRVWKANKILNEIIIFRGNYNELIVVDFYFVESTLEILESKRRKEHFLENEIIHRQSLFSTQTPFR